MKLFKQLLVAPAALGRDFFNAALDQLIEISKAR